MHSRKQWGICFGRTRACRVERVLGLDGMGIRIALFSRSREAWECSE
jgi:hypothetical protein